MIPLTFQQVKCELTEDTAEPLLCAECDQPIVAEAESSFCGSLHPACVGQHSAHCEICGGDHEEDDEDLIDAGDET